MFKALLRALPVAALVLSASPALAFDAVGMTEEEREAFRAEVRAYLLENPEVLMEAISVLEERRAKAQAAGDADLVAANADALFEDENSWVGGNPEGDVTVVEFLDYRCGYCKRAHPQVAELIESDGNIRLIVKEFPILGEQSVTASRFAIAVRMLEGDAAYRQVNNALMALRGKVTEAALSQLAAEVGLDFDTVAERMESPEVTQIIAGNRALGQRLRINGTPSFVFGDRMVRGYVPLEKMRDIVEKQREG